MVPEMGSDILNKTEGKNNVRLPWLQNSYLREVLAASESDTQRAQGSHYSLTRSPLSFDCLCIIKQDSYGFLCFLYQTTVILLWEIQLYLD